MPDKYTTVLGTQTSRREVIKKAAYMTPVILTLAAVPSFAAKGSGAARGSGGDNAKDSAWHWHAAEGSTWWEELLEYLIKGHKAKEHKGS